MLSFFNNPNNSDKFIVCGASEVSLFQLKDKNHETDFIYDSPKLQSIRKFTIIRSYQSFYAFVYVFSQII
jgi:hypothetical protein